jgi:hypothetical protein
MADDDVEYEPEMVTVGPYSFSLTTVSFMPLEKLLENQSKGVEISGQKVWCGSLVVAEYLLHHGDYVQDRVIFELGSGTGLLGMLCQRLGSASVFLTDHDQRSLNHMAADIVTNSIENTTVHKLDWFQIDDCERILPSVIDRLVTATSVRIVAGDVLYKNVLLAPFFSTVKKLFHTINAFTTGTSKEPCKMLLCHVPRAGVDQSDVVSAAHSASLQVRIIDEVDWKKGCVVEFSVPEDYNRAQLYELYL